MLCLKMSPANKSERCDVCNRGGGNGSGVRSFGKLADDSDESAVLVLQPLVVGLELCQNLGRQKETEDVSSGSFIIQPGALPHKQPVYGVKTAMRSRNAAATHPDWHLATCITALRHAGHEEDVVKVRERNSEINLSNLGHASPEKPGLKITLD